MRLRLTLALAAALSSTSPVLAQEGDRDEYLDRAVRLMRRTPLIDGHNDLPWQMRGRASNKVAEFDLSVDRSRDFPDNPLHTDIPRLREGRVGGQFWSVYIPIRRRGGGPSDVQTVMEQMDVVHRLAAMYPDDLEIALTAEDVERAFRRGKIASMIGMEGGHSINNSLGALRACYAMGARYMTLTHSLGTLWADSATGQRIRGGLTPFGEEVIREMNRLGMLVDLSHVSAEVMHDTLDVAEAPVIFSHSSARGLVDHPRNVPDDVLLRLRENGGLVMVTFVPSYISPAVRAHSLARRAEVARLQDLHGGDGDAVRSGLEAWTDENPTPSATISDVADHIEHVKEIAGIEHVGIGGDYDGISSLPVGLEDVSTYPDLIAEMLRRGWSDREVRALLGENVLRVMRSNERVAERLQKERPASDAIMEELDADYVAPPETVSSAGG
ncbi:MAG: dipeptidase [Planctomycetota bacterium]